MLITSIEEKNTIHILVRKFYVENIYTFPEESLIHLPAMELVSDEIFRKREKLATK